MPPRKDKRFSRTMSERAHQAESPPVIDCRTANGYRPGIADRLDKDTAFEKYNAVVAVAPHLA